MLARCLVVFLLRQAVEATQNTTTSTQPGQQTTTTTYLPQATTTTLLGGANATTLVGTTTTPTPSSGVNTTTTVAATVAATTTTLPGATSTVPAGANTTTSDGASTTASDGASTTTPASDGASTTAPDGASTTTPDGARSTTTTTLAAGSNATTTTGVPTSTIAATTTTTKQGTTTPQPVSLKTPLTGDFIIDGGLTISSTNPDCAAWNTLGSDQKFIDAFMEAVANVAGVGKAYLSNFKYTCGADGAKVSYSILIPQSSSTRASVDALAQRLSGTTSDFEASIKGSMTAAGFAAFSVALINTHTVRVYGSSPGGSGSSAGEDDDPVSGAFRVANGASMLLAFAAVLLAAAMPVSH